MYGRNQRGSVSIWIGDALVNVDPKKFMWEVIAKTTVEERKDENIEFLRSHDGIGNKG